MTQNELSEALENSRFYSVTDRFENAIITTLNSRTSVLKFFCVTIFPFLYNLDIFNNKKSTIKLIIID